MTDKKPKETDLLAKQRALLKEDERDNDGYAMFWAGCWLVLAGALTLKWLGS